MNALLSAFIFIVSVSVVGFYLRVERRSDARQIQSCQARQIELMEKDPLLCDRSSRAQLGGRRLSCPTNRGHVATVADVSKVHRRRVRPEEVLRPNHG